MRIAKIATGARSRLLSGGDRGSIRCTPLKPIALGWVEFYETYRLVEGMVGLAELDAPYDCNLYVVREGGKSGWRKAAGVPRDGLCAGANESRRRPRPVVPLPPEVVATLRDAKASFGETRLHFKERRRRFRRCGFARCLPGLTRRSCRRRFGPS